MSIFVKDDVLFIDNIPIMSKSYWGESSGIKITDVSIEFDDTDLQELVGFDASNQVIKSRVAQISFENGWQLRISWGNGANCSNFGRGFTENKDFLESSPDAELSAWNNEGFWLDFESKQMLSAGVDICPYVLAEDVLVWLRTIKNFPPNLPIDSRSRTPSISYE